MYTKTDRFYLIANVLAELVEPPGRTIEYLAEKLNYSPKTIHQIILDIIKNGWPVLSCKIPKSRAKRYYLKEEYQDRFLQFLPFLIRLTPDEQFLLKYLLEKEAILADTGLNDAIATLRLKLDKLILCDTRNQPSPIHTSIKHRRSYIGHEQILSRLMTAIRIKTTIAVSYRKAHQENQKSFLLQPYGITEYNGALYIVGLELGGTIIKTYAVDRFTSVERYEPESKFETPVDFSLDKYFEGSFGITNNDEPVRYTIRFAERAMNAIYMRSWGSDQTIDQNKDGSFILSFTSSGSYDIRTWILGFGEDAEMIEPEWMRKKIRAEIKSMSGRYNEEE